MKIEKRTNNLKEIRSEGYVPGIIYGHNIEATEIQVPMKELMKKYHENGLTMSFTVKLGKEEHIVFFKEIQKDPMKFNHFIHFDLMKVSSDDKMTASIPVHLIGKNVVEKKGFIVQLLADTLDFEFPVTKGISNIEVDITSLEGGDSLLVSDIEIPKDFDLQEEPSKVIVNITYPTIEKDEDEKEEGMDLLTPTTEEEVSE